MTAAVAAPAKVLQVGSIVTGPHGHPVHSPETWRVIHVDPNGDTQVEQGSIYLANLHDPTHVYDATLEEFWRYGRVE